MSIYKYKKRKNLSGTRVYKARKELRMSQSTLAAKLQLEGIPLEQGSISRMEICTRFVPDYELPVLAKILNVSVPWLLGME